MYNIPKYETINELTVWVSEYIIIFAQEIEAKN